MPRAPDRHRDRGLSFGSVAAAPNTLIPDGAFNHEKLIEFFEALVTDGKRAGKKVFLILDNLGVHHFKPVKAWLAEHQPDIEVFSCPATARNSIQMSDSTPI